jgi:hypothetical protein
VRIFRLVARAIRTLGFDACCDLVIVAALILPQEIKVPAAQAN